MTKITSVQYNVKARKDLSKLYDSFVQHCSSGNRKINTDEIATRTNFKIDYVHELLRFYEKQDVVTIIKSPEPFKDFIITLNDNYNYHSNKEFFISIAEEWLTGVKLYNS